MSMTITEKILALHAGRDQVRPGEIIEVDVDFALANDITAPMAIRVFEELGAKSVFNPEKIALVPDHFVPNKDIPSAEQARIMMDFAYRHSIKHYFEQGEKGEGKKYLKRSIRLTPFNPKILFYYILSLLK